MPSCIPQYTFWPFLHQHFPKYERSTSCDCFLNFFDVVLSRIIIITIIIIIIIIIIAAAAVEYSFMHLCRQLPTQIQHPKKQPRQTVFLMMNPRISEYVEDVKNRIKALIWKVCISLVYVA